MSPIDGDEPDAPEQPPPNDADERALRLVRDKAARMARARKRPQQLWRQLAQVGVLGWLFILPVVGLSALGHLLQRRTGQPLYGLAGVLLGLAIGAYVVFINVRRSLREDIEEQENHQENHEEHEHGDAHR